MREDSVSPLGAVLIVSNWVLATAILLEFAAVQDLLGAADANWQDQYDSGTMAFASLPVGFGVLLAVLVAFAGLSALAIRRVRSTALGWTSLVAHLALLVGIWNGPAAPGSSMDYWFRLSALTAFAATGIVAGANLRPLHRSRPSTMPLDALHSTPQPNRARR